jgi:hypothetical protein
LGRPPKNAEINAAHKQQLSADLRRRIEVEGVFGSSKQKDLLMLIMARLALGAATEVGAFYWTVPAPNIVNPGREEQGSVSV